MIFVNEKGQPILFEGRFIDCDECLCDPCADNECVFTPMYCSVFQSGGLLPFKVVNCVEVTDDGGKVTLPMTSTTSIYTPGERSSTFFLEKGDDSYIVKIALKYDTSTTNMTISKEAAGTHTPYYKNRFNLYYYHYRDGVLVPASPGASYTARLFGLILTDKYVFGEDEFNIAAGPQAFNHTATGESYRNKYDFEGLKFDEKIELITPPDFVDFRWVGSGMITGGTIHYADGSDSSTEITFEFKDDQSLMVGSYAPTIPDCPCPIGTAQIAPYVPPDDPPSEIVEPESSSRSSIPGSGSSLPSSSGIPSTPSGSVTPSSSGSGSVTPSSSGSGSVVPSSSGSGSVVPSSSGSSSVVPSSSGSGSVVPSSSGSGSVAPSSSGSGSPSTPSGSSSGTPSTPSSSGSGSSSPSSGSSSPRYYYLWIALYDCVFMESLNGFYLILNSSSIAPYGSYTDPADMPFADGQLLPYDDNKNSFWLFKLVISTDAADITPPKYYNNIGTCTHSSCISYTGEAPAQELEDAILVTTIYSTDYPRVLTVDSITAKDQYGYFCIYTTIGTDIVELTAGSSQILTAGETYYITYDLSKRTGNPMLGGSIHYKICKL